MELYRRTDTEARGRFHFCGLRGEVVPLALGVRRRRSSSALSIYDADCRTNTMTRRRRRSEGTGPDDDGESPQDDVAVVVVVVGSFVSMGIRGGMYFASNEKSGI